MKRLISANREQVFALPPKLDDWLPLEHPVRFVRDLVASLDLVELGFREPRSNQGGPVYDAALLVSVWVFGWMERVRSSRQLEKACYRDIAFLWLTGNEHPDASTLRRFFREHREPLRALFRQTVKIAADADLIGFALHALDGTKLAASSSFDAALHRKSLEEKLRKLDALTDEQLAAMELREAQDEPSYAMPEAMRDPEARRERLRTLLEERKKKLDKEGTDHLHPREPEARVMKGRPGMVFGYNAQAVVDHDSDLLVAVDVVNAERDSSLLVPMLQQARDNAGQQAAQNLADSGYVSGEQLAAAEEAQIEVLVNLPAPTNQAPYAKEAFVYDEVQDEYRCPQARRLPLFEIRSPTTGIPYFVGGYRCNPTGCPAHEACTTCAKGRTVTRSEHERAWTRQAQKQQAPAMRRLMDLRKEMIERVFGQIKGNDGFRRFLRRTLESASAEWALACTAFNLRKLYGFWQQGRLSLAA